MPDRGEGRRWCEDCERHVHDLSVMRESEALALVQQRVDEPTCVAYRADRRSGEVQFRDRAPRSLVVALALVGGCIGFDSPELELPDEPEPPVWVETTVLASSESELGNLRLLVLIGAKPVPEASIQLESTDDRWTGTSDAEGRWLVGELPPGSYTLHVQHGEQTALVRVEVRPGESSGARVTFTPEVEVIVGALPIDPKDMHDSQRLPVGTSTSRTF